MDERTNRLERASMLGRQAVHLEGPDANPYNKERQREEWEAWELAYAKEHIRFWEG